MVQDGQAAHGCSWQNRGKNLLTLSKKPTDSVAPTAYAEG
jgi:hypothetical protein